MHKLSSSFYLSYSIYLSFSFLIALSLYNFQFTVSSLSFIVPSLLFLFTVLLSLFFFHCSHFTLLISLFSFHCSHFTVLRKWSHSPPKSNRIFTLRFKHRKRKNLLRNITKNSWCSIETLPSTIRFWSIIFRFANTFRW